MFWFLRKKASQLAQRVVPPKPMMNDATLAKVITIVND